MELKPEADLTNENIEILETEQERVKDTIWFNRSSFRIALISTFTALTIVLGYLLIQLPNIELFTLMIFLSGFILGKRDGMIVGLLSSFIFCYFNPFGSSPLPLLAFQLIYYSITGLLGAFTSNLLQNKKLFKYEEDFYNFRVMVLFGTIGALITINFQIFSTIIHVLSFLGTLNEFLPYFLSGSVFTIVHIIGNTLGFIFILPGLIQLINKMLH
ncbi:MAG: ECF transporter S component [Candidatus Hodarchaeota archaeon]